MKAIMFAAGKSTRTYPLTVNKPKPMLKALDKSIIEHNLEQLSGICTEVIIVVGFMKDMLIGHINGLDVVKSKKIKVQYVEQKEQLGTGHALMQCQKIMTADKKNAVEKFIVMGGDDIFSKKDLLTLSKHEIALLACKVKNPQDYGEIEQKNGILVRINEKNPNPKTDLVNIGCYMLPIKIFEILSKTKKSSRGEIELTDAVSLLKPRIVEVKDYWLPITYPWNLLEANVFLLNHKEIFSNEGIIEPNVQIKGNVHIGKGTVIKYGSYIEGPVFIGGNCEIGPFAHIRKDTIIGNRCTIGKSELYDIVIMDNSTSKHISYLAHGVIGEKVNIGAGTIMADYRHDGGDNFTIIKGEKINTKRRKLGAFLGDNVHTGIGTLLYPGRKIWPGLGTLPGEIVTKDKMDGKNE